MWFRMKFCSFIVLLVGAGERLLLYCFKFLAYFSITVILLLSEHMTAGGVIGEAVLSVTRSGRHPRRKP